MTITEPAPAKINLALHIRRKRPDGYHDLETLFAFARDGDVVTIASAPQDSFTVTGPFAHALLLSSPIDADASLPLPSGEGRGPPAQPAGKGEDRVGDNLVIRAADAFRTAFGHDQPHAITLDKRLPVASGIGGGSADAAATLRALARLHGVELRHDRLFQIAAELGADVPACLLGRPALGVGKGDRLASLPLFGNRPLLLVNPRVPLATAPMFGAWDGVDRGGIPEHGTVLERAAQGRNDFTAAAIAAAPAIAEVLAFLEQASGAKLPRMSGSGATCFALFESSATRDASAIAAEQRGWWTLSTTLA